MSSLTVVKVGGSLYDWPQLGPRLRSFLAGLPAAPLLLIPGGGPTANVIRDLDRQHDLGEERAHWLALHALRLNAYFLCDLLAPARVVAVPPQTAGEKEIAILDALAFAEADEGRPGCLPHVWKATSDSAAARVAVVAGARQLILLKSTPIPAELGWAEAGRRGLVDPLFAAIVAQAPGLAVRAVNLRQDAG